MNNEQQLHQVEISLENARESIELSEALERLHHNSDFRKVILEDFFKQEASRVVMLRADPNITDPNQMRAIENIITGIGALGQYFGKVYRLGEMSIAAMEGYQDTREELLKENLIGDEQ